MVSEVRRTGESSDGDEAIKWNRHESTLNSSALAEDKLLGDEEDKGANDTCDARRNDPGGEYL